MWSLNLWDPKIKSPVSLGLSQSQCLQKCMDILKVPHTYNKTVLASRVFNKCMKLISQ